MRILLDTNRLTDALRQDQSITDLVEQALEVWIAFVTLGEVQAGLHGGHPRRRAGRGSPLGEQFGGRHDPWGHGSRGRGGSPERIRPACCICPTAGRVRSRASCRVRAATSGRIRSGASGRVQRASRNLQAGTRSGTSPLGTPVPMESGTLRTRARMGPPLTPRATEGNDGHGIPASCPSTEENRGSFVDGSSTGR